MWAGANLHTQSIAMHTFEHVSWKSTAGRGLNFLVSVADIIASKFNKWAADGMIDLMDGADGEEMNRLIEKYLNCGGHEEDNFQDILFHNE